jgi:hypothetical protein
MGLLNGYLFVRLSDLKSTEDEREEKLSRKENRDVKYIGTAGPVERKYA